jgi:hypothetical protein
VAASRTGARAARGFHCLALGANHLGRVRRVPPGRVTLDDLARITTEQMVDSPVSVYATPISGARERFLPLPYPVCLRPIDPGPGSASPRLRG